MYLVKKVKAILRNTRGETLIEGLASILVFMVLIVAVTMMIMLSMRVTSVTTTAAMENQEEAGALLRGNDVGGVPIDPDSGIIELPIATGLLPLAINVDVRSSENFSVFEFED